MNGEYIEIYMYIGICNGNAYNFWLHYWKFYWLSHAKCTTIRSCCFSFCFLSNNCSFINIKYWVKVARIAILTGMLMLMRLIALVYIWLFFDYTRSNKFSPYFFLYMSVYCRREDRQWQLIWMVILCILSATRFNSFDFWNVRMFEYSSFFY